MLKTLLQIIKNARYTRQTIDELSKLSDHELNDIGLSRGDIYSIARGDTSFKRCAE